MADNTYKSGDATSLYAVAIIFAVFALVMLFLCWQAAIPASLASIGFTLYAGFRAPTMIWDAEGITFTNPRRKLHQVFPYQQFACLYWLCGTTGDMLVFTPQPLSKAELRALVARAKKLHGPVPVIDGCLAIRCKRFDPKRLDLLPESVRRMPFSEGVSL